MTSSYIRSTYSVLRKIVNSLSYGYCIDQKDPILKSKINKINTKRAIPRRKKAMMMSSRTINAAKQKTAGFMVHKSSLMPLLLLAR